MQIGMDCRLLRQPIAGIGRYTINLVRELGNNTDDTLFTFGNPLAHSIDAHGNTVNINVPNHNEYLRFESLFAYLHNMDVIFSPYDPVPERRSCAGILTIHDVIPLVAPDWFEGMNVMRFFDEDIRRCVQHVEQIITVSQSARMDILEHYNIPEEKVTAIPLGPDPVFYSKMSEELDRRVLEAHGITNPYILSVCTLEPRKNLERVLLAYEEFREQHKVNVSLVLVGQNGWKTETLMRRLAQSRYKKDIIVTGYVRNEELPSLYRKSELFVYPSLYEGFGLPIVEAMVSGAPVLTSNTSSMPEVGGDAAIYCDPYDIESIRYGIEQVLFGTTHDRKILVEMGKKRAEKFTWSNTASLTRAVFEKVT